MSIIIRSRLPIVYQGTHPSITIGSYWTGMCIQWYPLQSPIIFLPSITIYTVELDKGLWSTDNDYKPNYLSNQLTGWLADRLSDSLSGWPTMYRHSYVRLFLYERIDRSMEVEEYPSPSILFLSFNFIIKYNNYEG